MAGSANTFKHQDWHGRIDELGRTRPDVVLMAPYMVYLLLLGLVSLLPPTWHWLAISLRGVGALYVVWLLRRHLPPWGRPYWLIAIPAGFFAAWLWYAGQYMFEGLGLGGRLPLYPGELEVVDPRDALGSYKLFWATTSLRVTVAITVVPVVEELFWRAFLLRALINWHDFDRIPLGKFAWISFLGTSLLSTLQHPDNWAVSILCWLFYNALFCWTRSILCLVIVHGITNLVLYFHVVRVGDWSFW
ncbi:MAG: CAAX prenyl protease-related protein [Planctomycetota bacterium]